MGRHPKSATAQPEKTAAFHDALLRTPHKWRACPLVRIEPFGGQCREVRRCPFCPAELVRPLRSLVLQYPDSEGATILPLASTILAVPIGVTLAEIQREVIEQVYEALGSIKATAVMLGISRRTLYNWCPELSLHDEERAEAVQSVKRRSRRVKQ